MIVAHWLAIRDLLAAGIDPLYEGQVPDQPSFPYSVLYMDTGNERDDRLCADQERADFRFQVTSAGLTAHAAKIRADEARSLLINVRPVVAGRTCTKIRHETAIPVRADTEVTDTETNRHPVFGVDTYHFVSYAA